MRSGWSRVAPNPIRLLFKQRLSCEKKGAHRGAPCEDTGTVMSTSQGTPRDGPQPPGARREPARDSSAQLQKEPVLLTPWSQISAPRAVRRLSMVFQPLCLWYPDALWSSRTSHVKLPRSGVAFVTQSERLEKLSPPPPAKWAPGRTEQIVLKDVWVGQEGTLRTSTSGCHKARTPWGTGQQQV